MGIDIYMRWPGQTPAEKEAQYTGFDITQGHTGYLREAYHGTPYATRVLVPEAFETGEATIPAATLRERLPATIETHLRRCREVYDDDSVTAESPSARSFAAFVELAERKELELGHPVTIECSA